MAERQREYDRQIERQRDITMWNYTYRDMIKVTDLPRLSSSRRDIHTYIHTNRET